MKNYCLVIICINKPFNCVIRFITIMIHNIRRNNSTIFNTDKLISLFDCIFDHFIWRETTFISLRQKIFSAQNFTHTVIKLSQFYKIFFFCISDNHRNLSLQLPICFSISYSNYTIKLVNNSTVILEYMRKVRTVFCPDFLAQL